MTQRLQKMLECLQSERRTGVFPYVTLGFPTVEESVRIVQAIAEAGADAIELGVPYSDPLADGPTIQAASYQALKQGVTPQVCLQAVRQLRQEGVATPLLFMGYFNLIFNYGLDQYASACAEAGVDALIVVDLPPEESAPLQASLARHGLTLVRFLAPTSPERRIKLACEGAEGFLYCASVAGVTGSRASLPDDLAEFLARVRRHTDLPLAVGFGVSSRQHVEAVGKHAEIAAVGSALTNVINSAPPQERAARAGRFVRELLGEQGG